MVSSVLTGDGQMARQPVTVTQPTINFESYSNAAIQTLLQILNGVLSPATIGLDIGKKDNADAQREKEKVTIFTRNGLIAMEEPTQKSLMIQLLIADQLLHSQKEYNTIELPESEDDWGISVKYDEFADASFEAKLETVLTAWQGGIMSDEMAIEYLHRSSPEDIKKRELKFIQEQRQNDAMIAGRDGAVPGDDELAELGAVLGGNENNPHNEQMEDVNIEDVSEDNGVPELGNYAKTHSR
jgi:hypothetical protein